MTLAQARLRIVPLSLKEANEYVADHHRHHRPVVGHRFSLGVVLDDELHGVAICGRPVARMVDWTKVLEVVRLATDGTPNACSVLYGASRRVAKEMGFMKIMTYTLAEESGISLRAAGWVETGLTAGGEWGRPSRSRDIVAPITAKRRWEVTFAAAA